MFFVLKFELIIIIGSNNVLTEGARKVYRGRRVGQGCSRELHVEQYTNKSYKRQVLSLLLTDISEIN
jgi:hypothetical protein